MRPVQGELVLRQMLSPQSTNLHGSVFGGELYGLCDMGAYVAARRAFPDRDFVTRSSSTEFLAPVFVADVADVIAWVDHESPSSVVRVRIEVRLERFRSQSGLHPAPASGVAAKMEFAMVAVKVDGGSFIKDPIDERPSPDGFPPIR